MKKRPGKLSLSRETLRRLDTRILGPVDGGVTARTDCQTCSCETCAATGCDTSNLSACCPPPVDTSDASCGFCEQ